MKESFSSFKLKISQTSPSTINKTLESLNMPSISLKKKSLLTYLQHSAEKQQHPKHTYYKTSPTLSGTHTKNNKSFTSINSKYASTPPSPYISPKKNPFQNKINTYIRLTDLLYLYLRLGRTEKKYKNNVLAYISDSTELDKVITEIDMYRQDNPQFQLLLYILVSNQDRLVSLYCRLRKQILDRCGLEPNKFKAQSVHNQYKYFLNQKVSLENIEIDFMYWGLLAEVAKCEISEEMLWDLTKGNRRINAVLFVQLCIWSMSTSKDSK